MALFFYIFASLLVLSSACVVLARNPVYSVLSLIFAFCNSAGLMVLLGAEFLAMMLIVVYVGAVAVLFLFTVMMLNINFAEITGRIRENVSSSLLIALLLLADILLVIFASSDSMFIHSMRDYSFDSSLPNVYVLGSVLYTDYLLPFQLAGLILFVAMVGAIALTFKRKTGVKRQDKASQLKKNKETSVSLARPALNMGVDNIRYD